MSKNTAIISFCHRIILFPRIEIPAVNQSFHTENSKTLHSTWIKAYLLFYFSCRINENDLFKHDWRSRSRIQVLQYVFLKWSLAFLVGLLTGLIASLINLAVENIAGYKGLEVVKYIENKRFRRVPYIYVAFQPFCISLRLLID